MSLSLRGRCQKNPLLTFLGRLCKLGRTIVAIFLLEQMKESSSLIVSLLYILLHIKTNKFEDLFPLKLNWLFHLPWQAERSLPELLQRFDHRALPPYDPLSFIKRAIPSSVPIKITEILPRLKDG